MALLRLSNELLLSIASSVEADRDLSAFARTNHRLHGIANDVLYTRDMRRDWARALGWASRHDRDDIGRLSLAAGGDAAMRGWALVQSAANGAEKMVELLLEGEEPVDLNVVDPSGSTAVTYAAEFGYLGILETLLALDGVNPDIEDSRGQTPLFHAAKAGHTAAVKMLLKTRKVRVDTRNEAGRSPLWEAARQGHAKIVKLLLSRRADPTLANDDDFTPLSSALDRLHSVWAMGLKHRIPGYLKTIELLLSNPATTVDFGNYHLKILCFRFALKGEETVLSRLLMKRNGIESNPVNSPEERHEAIIRMLAADEDFDVDRPDDIGRTLLSYAAQAGCTYAVKALLETGRVNVVLKDDNGRPPLYWAVRSRCQETLQLVFEVCRLEAARNKLADTAITTKT
jgi:ankyrin repeat protein